jgi:hypothetical protein
MNICDNVTSDHAQNVLELQFNIFSLEMYKVAMFA